MVSDVMRAPMRSGGLLQSPWIPRMEASMSGDVTPFYDDGSLWSKEFLRAQRMVHADLAAPCMYKNKAALRGGLKPKWWVPTGDNREVIMMATGEYDMVEKGKVRQPTDEEFVEYFQRLYRERPPKLFYRYTVRGAPLPEEEQYCIIKF